MWDLRGGLRRCCDPIARALKIEEMKFRVCLMGGGWNVVEENALLPLT